MYTVEQWKIIEKENERKSAIITAIITLLMLLILFFIVLGWPKEEDLPLSGMMIDFGTTETGQGNSSAPPAQNVATPVEEVNINDATPPPTSEPEVTPAVADEVVTQDVEEAPAITPEKPEKTPEQIAAEQAALEAQQLAEEQAAADQAAAEAAAAQAAADAAAQAEADALNDQLNNAWGDGGGDGNDGTPGDAGDPDGIPNGGDGWGTDGDGDGVWGLGGRKWAKKPSIENKSQNFGKVTLKIKVDKQGNIISAEFTNYKSTTTNSYLVDLAIKEVLRQGKITSNVNAPSEQWGYVTINFSAK